MVRELDLKVIVKRALHDIASPLAILKLFARSDEIEKKCRSLVIGLLFGKV